MRNVWTNQILIKEKRGKYNADSSFEKLLRQKRHRHTRVWLDFWLEFGTLTAFWTIFGQGF